MTERKPRKPRAARTPEAVSIIEAVDRLPAPPKELLPEERVKFLTGLLKKTLGTPKGSSKKKRAESQELTLPADFQLTPEFVGAFDVMENSEDHVFVTGRAGTGKSTLLQYFRSKTKKNFVVLAPTGAAAVNVGGSTIHSFFRFPPRLVTRDTIRRVPGRSKVFAGLETLVIDEVSMVRSDVMEAIDYGLRVNRGRPHEPFGGVQLILIGDLFQLPPVVEAAAADHIEAMYGTEYFFGSPAFRNLEVRRIELGRIFRQDDAEFIRLLNNVRNAAATQADIDALNQRHMPDFPVDEDDLAITLTATNDRANGINAYRLSALEPAPRIYEGSVTGMFDDKLFPTDARLALKEGAQVMMLRNDSKKRWVNGSLGIVHKLTPELVEVSINGGIHAVEPATWERVDYTFDAGSGRIEPVVLGTFRQYPMKLAWAITIHKSQGKTFDRVLIDFGRGAFTSGQAYVALSRCRTLDGIRLLTPIRKRDIMVDEVVKLFHGNPGQGDRPDGG